MKSRMIATVLILEAFLVFFALLGAHPLLKNQYEMRQIVGVALALIAVYFVAAGLARKPYGEWVGWAAQATLFVGGIWFTPMLWAAPVFVILYWWLVRLGKKIDKDRAEYGESATK